MQDFTGIVIFSALILLFMLLLLLIAIVSSVSAARMRVMSPLDRIIIRKATRSKLIQAHIPLQSMCDADYYDIMRAVQWRHDIYICKAWMAKGCPITPHTMHASNNPLVSFLLGLLETPHNDDQVSIINRQFCCMKIRIKAAMSREDINLYLEDL